MLIGTIWSFTAFLLIQRSLWTFVPAAAALLFLLRALRRSNWKRPSLSGGV
jgi:hypothetical protein